MRSCLQPLSVALVLYGAVLAQGPRPASPSAHGRVLDANGQPVAGVVVSLAKSGAPQALLCITPADGTYSFPDLEIGADYELKAGREHLASRGRLLRASNAGEPVTIDLILVAPIQFQDASLRSGLNFTLQNGAAGRFYQPEIMLGGVAAFDYNND